MAITELQELAFTNTEKIQELQLQMQKKIIARDAKQKHYERLLSLKCIKSGTLYIKFEIERLYNEIAVITEKINELKQTNKIAESEIIYHRCNSLYDKDFD